VESLQTTPSDSPYPDNGQPLEDRNILRNAVDFATGSRALEAELLLRQPLHLFVERAVAQLAVQAYGLYLKSTEDLLGWIVALRDWEPGTVAGALLIKVDRVRIEREEDKLEEALGEISAESWRKWLHIPSDPALRESGFTDAEIGLLHRQLAGQLDSVKKVLQLRLGDERGRVVAYNKVKHVMTGIYRPEQQEVMLVSQIEHRPEADGPGEVAIKHSLTIPATPEQVIFLAGQATASQAVLNVILGMVLRTRFSEAYEPPQWVRVAFRSPIWTEDRPNSRDTRGPHSDETQGA
jgi:hypothetical protein